MTKAEKLYSVTVKAQGRRLLAGSGLDFAEASNLCDRVNAGKVPGQTDALMAPDRKKVNA